jgi:hypothetical protein
MASQLKNLIKTLAWSDFGTPQKKTAPTPGHPQIGAFTVAGYKEEGNGSMEFVEIAGSQPTAYHMGDNVTVTATFDASQSWVADWVFLKDVPYQKNLLQHEQGHYDIAALIARDFFIDLMQLKNQSFKTKNNGIVARNAVVAKYKGVSKKVQDEYDHATTHGTLPDKQKLWNGYIERAFTIPRTPQVQAPNGVLYKLPLLEVLKANGVII